MIKGLSKFDQCAMATEDGWVYVISAQRYSKAEADVIAAEQEMGIEQGFLRIKSYARHRAGTNSDGERSVGWWFGEFDLDVPVWMYVPSQLAGFLDYHKPWDENAVYREREGKGE